MRRIYVFREGQGNEGSDKCSGQAENSWMQRGEQASRKGKDGRGKCEGMDAFARLAHVIETNSILRIVSDARTRRGLF